MCAVVRIRSLQCYCLFQVCWITSRLGTRCSSTSTPIHIEEIPGACKVYFRIHSQLFQLLSIYYWWIWNNSCWLGRSQNRYHKNQSVPDHSSWTLSMETFFYKCKHKLGDICHMVTCMVCKSINLINQIYSSIQNTLF